MIDSRVLKPCCYFRLRSMVFHLPITYSRLRWNVVYLRWKKIRRCDSDSHTSCRVLPKISVSLSLSLSFSLSLFLSFSLSVIRLRISFSKQMSEIRDEKLMNTHQRFPRRAQRLRLINSCAIIDFIGHTIARA